MVRHMAKGVSEIVSQILMILLVMSIGTVILTYSMGYFSGLSGANDLMTKMNGDTLKERFIIVNVNNSGSNELWVSVYNYGEQNIRIDALYVMGESRSITKTVILPGDFETIYGGTLGQLPLGESTFTVRVVSSLGNYYENIYLKGTV